MVILALDQSSKETGWSVFNTENGNLIDFGLISLDNPDLSERLFLLRERVKKLIEEYHIDKVFLEDIQYQPKVANSVTTFKVLAEVIGVLTELFCELNIPNQLILSSVWKSHLGIKGTKRSEQKANAKKYVEEHYELPKKITQDMADSICIGSYCISL